MFNNDMEPDLTLALKRLQIAIKESRGFVASEFERLSLLIEEKEINYMATFAELMTAIQTNGMGIATLAQTLNDKTAEIKALITRIQAGSMPSAAEIQTVLDNVNQQSVQLGEITATALQLVPTVESPTEPPTPGTEVPTPTEPVPTTPAPIEITPAPEVGVDGSVNIDV